jgi:hypothetical protein
MAETATEAATKVPAATQAPVRPAPPRRLRAIKRRIVGTPLATERLVHERLGKPTALAVFASDNLSSSAYATEEILRVLLYAGIGTAAFAHVVPITVALLLVLAVLLFSYRQTIKAYPQAGGAYLVTRDNFGLLPAQVAGVALLTDYVLTVSVSVAAGTAAVTSVFGSHAQGTVPLRAVRRCLGCAIPAGYEGTRRSVSSWHVTVPVCGAVVTKPSGERVAGPCVLPLHHLFFHLWVDAHRYSWHWDGPCLQVMGDVTAEHRVRIEIFPPGWSTGESDTPGETPDTA